MAALATHLAGGMGEFGEVVLIDDRPPCDSILLDGLGQPGFLTVMGAAGSDGVENLYNFPLQIFIHDRALIQPVALPIELPLTKGSGSGAHVDPVIWCGWTAHHQGDATCPVAVAAFAGHDDYVSAFAVELAIAVAVLLEVAIGALHALFLVDVGEVHGFLEFIFVVPVDDVVVCVEQIAFAVVLVYRAEDPAVAVEVGKLRLVELFVELRRSYLTQEAHVAPFAAVGSAFRIAYFSVMQLLLGGIVLLLGIHLLAIDFVVPPGVAVVSGDHIRAWMHVADHALARRDGEGEHVAQRMSMFVFGNRRIGLLRHSLITVLGILCRVPGIAIVGINHVAASASALAVVTGLFVGSRE